MRLRLAMLVLATAALWSAPAAAQKLPSSADGYRHGAMYNGKQNMPYVLYGVAIKWHQACVKGKAAECLRLADAYEQGLGELQADMRVTIAYLLKACELGSGPGCGRAAAVLRDGSASFVNAELAQQMAERGCNALKHQPSCAAMAVGLASKPGGSEQAAALIEQSCAAGADDGCRLKANALFFERKDAASRAQAMPMFDKACVAKRAWGCEGLATAYREGWGVAKDLTKASEYTRVGCTQGVGERLRLCTLHGINLSRPSDRASLNQGEKFLDASCTAGDGMACNHIGRIGLSRVDGATTTENEGLYYLRRGCDLNFGPACGYLSVAYSSGIRVNRDDAVALALNEKGCRLGDGESCAAAKKLLASDPGLRSRIPAIDPSLPVAEQLRLAKARVETVDKMTGVAAVVRLMQESNEDAEWMLGGWLYYGLDGVFDQSRKKDGLILFENAARVGHVDAAIYMGMAYWYGDDGLAQDRPKGERYMAIAAQRGSRMAGAIYRSMKNEPIRQEYARRQAEMEEAARNRKVTWADAMRNWKPSWSSPSLGPAYSGSGSVASVIDNSNWNQRISYLSGTGSVCPASNSYCR
jgi:TPR repeat protein